MRTDVRMCAHKQLKHAHIMRTHDTHMRYMHAHLLAHARAYTHPRTRAHTTQACTHVCQQGTRTSSPCAIWSTILRPTTPLICCLSWSSCHLPGWERSTSWPRPCVRAGTARLARSGCAGGRGWGLRGRGWDAYLWDVCRHVVAFKGHPARVCLCACVRVHACVQACAVWLFWGKCGLQSRERLGLRADACAHHQ